MIGILQHIFVIYNTNQEESDKVSAHVHLKENPDFDIKSPLYVTSVEIKKRKSRL